MNKTVNINLAGVFFHIDEDAFIKLSNYLNAIKNSLTGTQGKEEIIQDIEARIAELFSEKMKPNQQVVSIKEVDSVIEIMGQPEDYKVDDDIFEDEEEPKSKTYTFKKSKKLYRDPDDSYVSGVSSGLGHYLQTDAIWIRVLFVLLTILSSGGFLFVYILFWVLVPEAITTSEKLEMRGEPINISNIEKKVREGFDAVSDKIKDVDYKKYTKQANEGSSQLFKSFGEIIASIAKIIIKFIGIIILIFSGLGLIGLFFSILSIGTFGIFDAPWMDYIEMVDIGIPIWLASIILFFTFGIPLFFIFLLGLKIAANNLKSIGTPAKLTLLGVWILSIFIISFLGIRQATQRAFEEDIVIKKALPLTANDTLYVKMQNNDWPTSLKRDNDVQIKYNQNNEKVIFSKDIRLIVKSTTDTVGRLEIVKSANGKDYVQATERARNIIFNTEFKNNTLFLDGFFTTAFKNKYADQEVVVTLYLPEGIIFFADENTSSYHKNNSWYEDILESGQEAKYLKVDKNKLLCLHCNDHLFEKEQDSKDVNDNKTEDDWYSDKESDTNLEEQIQPENKEADSLKQNTNPIK